MWLKLKSDRTHCALCAKQESSDEPLLEYCSFGTMSVVVQVDQALQTLADTTKKKMPVATAEHS
jgi:hypothetical protein